MIVGGSGGTGSWGIQFAKQIGCFVATTCSTRNIEYVQSLGADQVIGKYLSNRLDISDIHKTRLHQGRLGYSPRRQGVRLCL